MPKAAEKEKDIPADRAILPSEEARALEREIDNIKREMKEFVEKTTLRLDGVRHRLLRPAA